MNSVKHIFFDLDNTLWDFIKNSKITLQKLYEKYDVETRYSVAFPVWHAHYYKINEQLWHNMSTSLEDLRSKRFKMAFEAVGIKDKSIALAFEKAYLNHLPEHNFLCEGAKDLLDYVYDKKQYKMHILTNGFREVSYRKLEESGIKYYFNTIISAEDAGKRKPHPDIFRYALDRTKASKEESIIIGDNFEADIAGGTNFGIRAVFYNFLGNPTKKGNFTEINHLSELKKYL